MKIKYFKKKSNGKYQLCFYDNTKVSLYEEIILRHQLLLKKDIDDDYLKQLIYESEEIEIYRKALKMIQKKNRSEKEIRTFFSKNFISLELQDAYIFKMKELGYLNDEHYLESYIHDKLLFTLEGPFKITNDLLGLGFKLEKIENCLNLVSREEWLERAHRYMQKQLKKTLKGSNNSLKNKFSESLYCLGYSKEMIAIVLKSFTFDHSSNLISEYEKLYQKFSSKYDGYILENKIRQKLYQKGYPVEDIDKLKK